MAGQWVITHCVHAHPDDDVLGHELSPTCPCGPTEERVDGPPSDQPRFVYTHHSLDGREQVEVRGV